MDGEGRSWQPKVRLRAALAVVIALTLAAAMSLLATGSSMAQPGDVDVTGTARVMVDAGRDRVVLTVNGTLVPVNGLDAALVAGQFATGDRVTLRVPADSPLASVAAAASPVARVAPVSVDQGALVEVNAAEALPNTDERRHDVLLVRATWPGADPAQLPSAQQADAALEDASAWWLAATGGAVQLAQVGSAPVDVSLSESLCSDPVDFTELLTKLGWSLSARRHVVVFVPYCSEPPFGDSLGFASLGGTPDEPGFVVMNGLPSVTPTNGTHVGWVLTHEFGHNLSLGHTNEASCAVNGTLVTSSTPGNCRLHEYGGVYSVMGASTRGYQPPALDGHHLFLLGLSENALQDVEFKPPDPIPGGWPDSWTTEVINLRPAGIGFDGRFARISDSSGASYYLAYHNAFGLDYELLNDDNAPALLPSGVTVTKVFDEPPGTAFGTADLDPTGAVVRATDAYLLDANTGSNPRNPTPMTAPGFDGDPVLTMGQSVRVGDLEFLVDTTSDTGAQVTVTFYPPRTAPTVPGVPSLVRGSASGRDVTVAWRAPASNGGVFIDKYEVTAHPGSATCVSPGLLQCTIAALPAGTTYTFSVAAHNTQGWSAVSPESDPVTIAAAPSSPPTPTPTVTPQPSTNPTSPPQSTAPTSGTSGVTAVPAVARASTDPFGYSGSTTSGSTTSGGTTSGTSSPYGSTSTQTLATTGASGVATTAVLGALLLVGGVMVVLLSRPTPRPVRVRRHPRRH